jgi:hypothetical protein
VDRACNLDDGFYVSESKFTSISIIAEDVIALRFASFESVFKPFEARSLSLFGQFSKLAS